MNLREDINRIKEVMGINESRDMFFKRRQEEFLEDVLNSFDWMDVEESNSLEEYVEDILRHSIDSFFGYNNILVTSEEIAELLPLALKILRSKEQLYKQIKGYWYRNNFTSRIDESKDRFLMRRKLEFNNYIFNHFGNVNPQKFDTFEDYLKYVLRYALMIFFTNVADEGDLKRDEMEELIPIALHHLENNRDLYDEIKKEYFKEIRSEQHLEKSESVKSTRMNENRDFMFFKRREDELMEYLISTQQLLNPEFFETFSQYYDTLINATIVHFYENPNTFPEKTEENIRMLRKILVRLLNNNEDLINLMKDDFEQSKA